MTIGIMALEYAAKAALESICRKYPSLKFKNLESLHTNGSVFLKGNQKTGNVYIRPEDGLGEDFINLSV